MCGNAKKVNIVMFTSLLSSSLTSPSEAFTLRKASDSWTKSADRRSILVWCPVVESVLWCGIILGWRRLVGYVVVWLLWCGLVLFGLVGYGLERYGMV